MAPIVRSLSRSASDGYATAVSLEESRQLGIAQHFLLDDRHLSQPSGRLFVLVEQFSAQHDSFVVRINKDGTCESCEWGLWLPIS